MDQSVVAQPAKKGRKPRPAVQLTRIRVETIKAVDRLCVAINALRGPGDAQAMRPQVIEDIVARYGSVYLADTAQQFQHRAQAALGAAQGAAVPQTHADALRLLLPDVPPLPEFAAPR